MGCQENLPTMNLDNLIPTEAITVEARLTFDEFAENLRVYGGYGSPAELPYGMMAHKYEGELEARALFGFWPFPVVATVRDTTGTSRPDSSLVFVGGTLVVLIDTIASIHGDSVAVAVGAVQQPWHFESANWQVAVDTVGDLQPWAEEGASPVISMATTVWDPSVADTMVFVLDSADVALLADTAAAAQGIRLDALTEGVRIQAYSARLMLKTRPSSNPDTLVDVLVHPKFRTFIYEPVLEAPESDFRVGGVPAWRTVWDMNFPEELNGPQELCDKVGCPFVLEPDMVNSASLYLTTKAPPPGFVPSDPLRLDIRGVLAPERLPKSPLGTSLAGSSGVSVPFEYFADSVGTRIEVPIGGYVVELIRGVTATGGKVEETMVILSSFEPLSLPFGEFYGPGSASEPEIRLILTVGGGVEIR
jgi:hypothetical protein